MIKTYLKFLFRLYVSFSNPAYIDWRKQLRSILISMLTASDKRFVVLEIVAAFTVMLEAILHLAFALFAVPMLKISTAFVVGWLLSILFFILAAFVWLKGMFRQLIRLQVFQNLFFRRKAWLLFLAGVILNLVSYIG